MAASVPWLSCVLNPFLYSFVGQVFWKDAAELRKRSIIHKNRNAHRPAKNYFPIDKMIIEKNEEAPSAYKFQNVLTPENEIDAKPLTNVFKPRKPCEVIQILVHSHHKYVFKNL